ncbi:methyl-accepting chemotaxis protein [Paenibacillus mucilaginosus]|uniref:Methyl-accepting chemotaxis sensory transducer n=1 Tax=Paenibacillus mucilaginosus (strain KNP414) TaxID=1036673 RepID=F8FRC1_PAEMK|nr:methyl-accepting chemotaxis protein [Paenibacillus mucilaginosus]AEI39371.1 methyl-accepting chemotaxis sensory transducer [Paenibacillus mucilaginosus KNP414]MCG7214785.1 methyl-accepting chemotaxis protein [Paenibacillus mucilaginosus]WDM28359.1 chemotaxis protein [Paenibacillus mucilaginosus]
MELERIYNERNRTLIVTAWVLLGVGALVTIGTGFFLQELWKIISLGMLPIAVLTYLYKKNIFAVNLKYLILLSLAVYLCSIVWTTKSIYALLLVFIPLVLTMNYPDSKPVLFIGAVIIGYVAVLSFGYPDQVFVGLPAERVSGARVNVIQVFFLVTLALYMLSKNNIRTLVQTSAMLKENQEQKEQNEKLLGELRSSIEYLTDFSSQLRQNIEVTGRTARDIAVTFHEISKGAELQATSISEISDSMNRIDSYVGDVLRVNTYVTELAGTARQETEKGNGNVKTLFTNIQTVEETAASTSQVMEQLNSKMGEIDTILSAIQEIASQTNLLSLNASIEAARAGEAGKGFSVVAAEIRKLAEHSERSAKDISGIMGQLRAQSNNVSAQIQLSNQSVEKCVLAMGEVEESFRTIHRHIQGVSETTESVKAKSESLDSTLKEVSAQTETVAAVTEESSAGVEQTLESNMEQTRRIEGIVEEFDKLDQMIANLSLLAQNQK